jgi:hypothetical protein
MNIEEVNAMLKETVSSLVENGWSKTRIAKIMLGANGQAQIVKLLECDDNQTALGLKPLTKIAKLMNYNLYLSFIDDNNDQLIKNIDHQNIQFFTKLKEQIELYLDKHELQQLQLTKTIGRDTQELLKNLDI